MNEAPLYTLHPTPYTLQPAPYTLHLSRRKYHAGLRHHEPDGDGLGLDRARDALRLQYVHTTLCQGSA